MRARRIYRRPGFTLLELTLVLALLVMLSTIIVPRLTGSAASRRLGIAADQVRATWTKARNRAMLTGDTQQFLYRPGTRSFVVVVEPISQDTEMAYQQAVSLLASAATLEEETPFAANTTTEGFQVERLPFDVTFIDAASFGDSESLGANASLTGNTRAASTTYINAQANSASGQSAGIAMLNFYPDGTTSTSTVWLANEDEEVIPIWLRGLTGIANVGEIVVNTTRGGRRGESR